MKWKESAIEIGGERVRAIAPEVISASRATDVPAFFGEWFVEALRRGWCVWRNPFNRREQYVSFERAKAVVFWSKNPAPFMRYLPELDARGISYYFQFTLNDYEREGLEPTLPALSERIATFSALSRVIGPERVVWRFDPLLATDRLGVTELAARIERIGRALSGSTERLAFSFIDIARYRRVGRSLRGLPIACRELSEPEMAEAGERIGSICRDLGLAAAACSESVDLSRFGVAKNKCVDDDLILRITGCDPDLVALYRANPLKRDPGQRPNCRCAPSKDIGAYGTCSYRCAYCYAGYKKIA